MNKSSSFYSEQYYQKARKQAHIKKPVYRQRNKQLYDQQHELEILKYYKNKTNRCEMIYYYEMISELYFNLNKKTVKGSDEYNQVVADYLFKVNEKIRYFHQFLMCEEYETPEQVNERIKKENYQLKKEENEQTLLIDDSPTCEQIEPIQQNHNCPKRLDTCNQCPIFIEEYQVNFERMVTSISKQSANWEKLNGNQKIAKFKKLSQQNLKILKFQLQFKCQFAQKIKKRKANYGIGRRY